MDKRYRVDGMFSLEVEGRDNQEAEGKVKRILKCSGIDGIVIEVEEVKTDE